ncbi:MAG: RagB/SusD family nutrient uptake outer membrane protein [Gemmatimonadota bacterium]|nr:RagB/SusD family nutrient uptake outer membrane protein [Gemmatimonadota bacterium]
MNTLSKLAVYGVTMLALASCDTNVTNPGPVQDEFLDREEAYPAVVSGMGRALAQATNWIGYTSAAVAREIHPSGSTGSFGITVFWQNGVLDATDRDLNVHWNEAQRARWFAEDGIRRMEEGGASTALLSEAYLWAGYANRLLGETYCEAVIDGGAPEASTVFLDRAEGWFTKAAQAGSGDVATAAMAGRASVLADLGQWAAAAADAATVADGFKHVLPYFELGENDQRNRIQYASYAEPYKAHTQWNTWVDAYYRATADPRVPFMETTEVGDAAIGCCGRVAWWPQQKYPETDSPINLSSGAEMRLIQAEAYLNNVGGDWTDAMTVINALRAAAGVPDAVATTADEAWTALKRERAIVLWLEARRLPDLRRWEANATPGDLDPLEVPGADPLTGSHLVQQDKCFPIPPSEQETNPNVPVVPG